MSVITVFECRLRTSFPFLWQCVRRSDSWYAGKPLQSANQRDKIKTSPKGNEMKNHQFIERQKNILTTKEREGRRAVDKLSREAITS